MLFNYPSFISQNEQDRSRLLYNNIKIVLQTSIEEIWYDVDFGTHIRDVLKKGINALIVSEIAQEIEDKLAKYFADDLRLIYLDAYQEDRIIRISLTYEELQTGKMNTVEVEQTFVNNQLSQY